MENDASSPSLTRPQGEQKQAFLTAQVDGRHVFLLFLARLTLLVMDRAARSAAALSCVLLVACTGSRKVSSLPEARPILAAADQAAKDDGGLARRVEAVKTTRGVADDYTGHGNQNRDEVVWVVEVSGSHYVCRHCSAPSGDVPAPRGDYFFMVLRASDWVGTDGGLEDQPSDLGKLGKVEVLRG